MRWCKFAILLAALAGCQPAAGPPAATNVAGKKIELIQADGKALDALIATHKGQVVFVDYWATWCGPCVENFPHTVSIAGKYRDQGLATIAVSFDLLDDQPKVRDFLAVQKADFENLISQHDSIGQRPAVDFEVEALPQYRLYDRQGKLRHKWDGKPDDLEQRIEELLAEK
jgi:thiol-disulfide isomerase/thioredoxin